MLLDSTELVLSRLSLDIRKIGSLKNTIFIYTNLSSPRNSNSQALINTVSLINTESTAEIFADEKFLVKRYNITTKKLVTLKLLRLIDGISSSYILKYFTIKMTMK